MDNLNLKNRLNTKVQAIGESAELAENTSGSFAAFN